jgi:serine/threonine protein phosphatase PrpC
MEQCIEEAKPAPSVSADTAVVPGSSQCLLTPLDPGTRLQDRYVILEVKDAGADKIVYRAHDERRCPDPTCRAENPPGEQFCQNCGRELTERGTCLLEERVAPGDDAAVAGSSFKIGARVYTPQDDVPSVAEQPKPFPSGVRLSFGAKSDVGLMRGASGDPDEDSVFAMAFSTLYESVTQPTVGLFIVADGIGGSEAGEVASKMCLQIVVPDLMRQIVLPILEGKAVEDAAVRVHIQDAILKANDEIYKVAQDRKNDMGTTITLALVVNDNAYIASVGDSRTYLFADGKLRLITRDHSLVASLVERKMIQPEEIYTHPQRNMIVRSLGAKPELDVDLFPAEDGALKLKPGSRLLLCCDGLWEMVRDDEMEEEMWQESDPQKLCDKLVARANQMGGEDNISAITVIIEQ